MRIVSLTPMVATCLLGLLHGSLAAAQPLEGGARIGALGGSATALAEDVWGHANPATRGTLSGPTAAFFVSQGYGLPELRLGAFILAVPSWLGTLTGGAQTFGFEAFRQYSFLLGYARGLRLGPSRQIYLGVDIRYHRISIPEYGSAGTFGLSVGWMADVLPGLSAGFQAANVNSPRFADSPEMDRTIAVGIAYHPVESLSFLLDTFKEVRFPLSVRSGLEFRPVPALALRTGIATAPVRWALGTGVHVHNLAADLVAERHEVLGWTPGLSVGLSW